MRQFLLAAVAALIVCCVGEAKAQSTVVQACGTLPATYPPGAVRNPTVDVNGNACIGGTISAVANTVATATAASPTYSEGQVAPLSQNLTGFLRVLATIDTTGLATAAGQTTGNNSLASIDTKSSALATIATNTGNTATALGSPFQSGGSIGNTSFAATQAVAANLNATVVGTGTFAVQATLAAETTKVIGTVNQGTSPWIVGLPALAATSTLQTSGGQKTQIVDGSGNVIASTSNNLNVQCANCSGSGASAVDEASFTAGTSVMAPAGGFFQTTATSNALTNGQQGMWQFTAQRAGFVNLRDTAGVALGTSTAELFVGGRGTAGSAAGGVLTVQGVASMTPFLVAQATAANLNATVVGTGTFAVQATLAAETTKVIGTVNQGTSPWVATGSGTAGTAATGVLTVQGIASMTPLLANPGTAANWAIGATGSGVPANTSFIGLSDGTNLRGWLNAANSLNSTGAGIGTAQIIAQFDDVAPTSITENQFGNMRVSANRNLYSTLRDAAGNERGANVNASNQLSVSVDGATISNLSVNLAQIASNNTSTGNGVAGTGVQRVSVASDNSAVAGFAVGATGSAPPANGLYNAMNMAGNLTGMIGCDSSIVYDASTSGSTQLVALTSTQTIYVCGYSLGVGGTATNVKLIYGTGTACATGSTNMTPAYQLAANGGLVDRGMYANSLRTAASNALCINTSAANAVQAVVYYTKF